MRVIALAIVLTEIASFIRAAISDPAEEPLVEAFVATYCILLVVSTFYLFVS